MKIDEFGRAYTLDPQEAKRYQVKDTSIQIHRLKEGLKPIDKYTPLYSYDRVTKKYWLPPCKGKGNIRPDYLIDILRDYQIAWLTELKQERTWLIVAWTGTGKTYIMAWAIDGSKTIIIVPYVSIAQGIKKEFINIINNNNIYYSMNTWNKRLIFLKETKVMTSSQIKETPSNKLPNVLIMTRASAYKCRDYLMDLNIYKKLLIDEVHMLSDTTKEMINTFTGYGILWVTATPIRKNLDKEGFKKYFWQCIDLQWENLPSVIIPLENKYEMPIEEYVKLTEWIQDPTSPEALRKIVNWMKWRREKIAHFVRNLILSSVHNRCIIFVDRISELERYCKEFPEAIPISGINKVTPALEEYKRRKLDIPWSSSYNTNKLKEWYNLIIWMSQCTGTGFNIPSLTHWVLTFSTRRAPNVKQYIWRMRRMYNNKTFGVFIDIQDKVKIGNQYRDFWTKDRMDYYKSEDDYSLITKNIKAASVNNRSVLKINIDEKATSLTLNNFLEQNYLFTINE